MVRTLPAAISNALASSTQSPALTLTVQDLQARLTQLAIGGTPGRSAALLSSSGVLLRASVDQAAATNQALRISRITPATAGSWTTDSTILTTAVARAGCAIVQTGSLTRIFFQNTSDNTIHSTDSTDDGLTWSASVALPANPDSLPFCYGICATDTTHVWSAWAAFDPNGMCSLYESVYSTSWSAWSQNGPSSPGWGQIRGLNVLTPAGSTTSHFSCGVGMRGYTSGISAGQFTLSGGAYSPIGYIRQLDTPTHGLTCAWPDLFYDTTSGATDPWYAAVTLTDDGSLSTDPHTRTEIWRSADGTAWHLWLACGTAFQYGAHVLLDAGTLYVYDAAAVYTVTGPPAAVDISDRVLAASIHEAYNSEATAEITLDNNDAALIGQAWLIDNATLTLALGYSGSAITTHTLYLDGHAFAGNAESQELHLTARDCLKLAAYPALDQTIYENETTPTIAADLLTRSGLTLDPTPGTPQFSATIPCFIKTPGQTHLETLKRLADTYGFEFFATGGASVILIEPQVPDQSSWTYDQPGLSAAHGQTSNRPNVVRVLGAQQATQSIWSEAVDTANIEQTGQARLMILVDHLIDTSAKAQTKAALQLRIQQREATHGRIIVPLNPAHQLGDVVTLTDAGVGYSSTAMRISGIAWAIDFGTAEWTQTLTLEAP